MSFCKHGRPWGMCLVEGCEHKAKAFMPTKEDVPVLDAPINFGTVDFATARKIMARQLKDPDMRLGYVTSVAMLMYDQLHERGYTPKLRPEDRNEIAENLIELIFEG